MGIRVYPFYDLKCFKSSNVLKRAIHTVTFHFFNVRDRNLPVEGFIIVLPLTVHYESIIPDLQFNQSTALARKFTAI